MTYTCKLKSCETDIPHHYFAKCVITVAPHDTINPLVHVQPNNIERYDQFLAAHNFTSALVSRHLNDMLRNDVLKATLFSPMVRNFTGRANKRIEVVLTKGKLEEVDIDLHDIF